MGASDSKLVFKQGIHKAQQERNIPADDPYWTGFWQLPESVEDVFSLFSPADIRRIRDESLGNLETLILAVTSRLFVLRNHTAFPNLDTVPASDALNCVRVLTRVLPFIYEEERLEAWEENFFWAPRRGYSNEESHSEARVLFDGDTAEDSTHAANAPSPEKKPLAAELIDTLIDLLFFTNFTIPKASASQSKVHLAIWQSGVGCTAELGTTKEFDANKLEVLRLLLTLCSKAMYMSPNALPVKGVRALTYMSTAPQKQVVMTLLCSILNTTLKYNPSSWHVPYDHVVLKDTQQGFVTYCLQFLLVLVLYPVPDSERGLPQQNAFRHLLGKLHRSQDFEILVDGMTRVLNQPLQATSSYLPGSQKSLAWAPEMIMLFWEVLQCNKRFRSFVTHSDRMHEFVVLILFYALHHKNNLAQQGIVRMCAFVLQTLSVEPAFAECLNMEFEDQDSLPLTVRVANFRGTYTDYLIISIHALITTSNGKLDVIYPALLAILNNLAPHVGEISPTASLKLMQLFSVMSAPDFLFANETNPELLKALLESFNAIIEYQYERNAYFILALMRSQKHFVKLHGLMVNGASEQLERHARLRKERAEVPSHIASPRRGSSDSARTPTSARVPSLSNVPETGETFTIGDDEDSENDEHGSSAPPARSASHSEEPSRAASISSSVDEAVPTQLRGMSDKARGKMPASPSPFSRHGSSVSLSNLALSVSIPNGNFEPNEAWVEDWLPQLPMQTTLTVVDQLAPHMPPAGSGSSTKALAVIRQTEVTGIDASPRRIHLFEWSPLSLGWYESLLWGFIFSSEVTMFKGAVGVWKSTHIKLFRVQEAATQGPSLMAPRGAVDAVGNNLVQRIGSLNFRGASQTAPRNASGGRTRDV